MEGYPQVTDFQAASGGRIWSSGNEEPVKYRFSTFTVFSFYISLAIIWLLSGAFVFLFADQSDHVTASGYPPIPMMVWTTGTGIPAAFAFLAGIGWLDYTKRKTTKKLMKVIGIILGGAATLAIAFIFYVGGSIPKLDWVWASTQAQTLTHNPDFKAVHVESDKNDANHFTVMATSPEGSVLMEIHYTDGEWKAALK